MVRKNVPLAQQIVQEILCGIEAGTLPRDDGLLPSEAELSQRFNVSRATIREALAQLEYRGVILRRHGVGTFVAQPLPQIETGLEELESLDSMAQRIGMEIHCDDAVIEERAANPAEAKFLSIPAASQVLSVTRVIATGDQPIAYLIDVVPTDLLRAGDLGSPFGGSVLDVLIQRGTLALSHSRTEIMVTPTTETIARKLHLKRGDMLLKLEAQLIARDGRVVDYSVSHFVPGYFRFHVIRRVSKTNGADLALAPAGAEQF